jgi:hypothetical protein
MIDASVLPSVMPAHAGIHDLLSLQQRESWIPACAGMTGGSGLCVNVQGRWYQSFAVIERATSAALMPSKASP